MSEMLESMALLADKKAEELNDWVYKLFSIRYDGFFKGSLIGQFENPFISFKIVFQDLEHLDLKSEEVTRIRRGLISALHDAFDKYSESGENDSYVMSEFNFAREYVKKLSF